MPTLEVCVRAGPIQKSCCGLRRLRSAVLGTQNAHPTPMTQEVTQIPEPWDQSSDVEKFKPNRKASVNKSHVPKVH